MAIAMVRLALITRPQPDADSFARDCRSVGIEPVIAPLMSIAFHDVPVVLPPGSALAFTSANGVRAFQRLTAWREAVVFAVGPASAEAARAAGFQTVHSAGGDVDDLAEMIAAHWDKGGDVLHIAGAHRAGNLVAALKGRGLSARRQVLYETRNEPAMPVAAAQALSGDARVDVALFSPRTARLFASLADQAGLGPALGNHRAVCLSDNVAAELDPAAWGAIAVAAAPNTEATISILSADA